LKPPGLNPFPAPQKKQTEQLKTETEHLKTETKKNVDARNAQARR
jgi:hypothetical protein